MFDRGEGIDIVERSSDARQALLRYVNDIKEGNMALDRHFLIELISRSRSGRVPLP